MSAATAYFDQLIAVNERLIAVLAHENDLLAKRKLGGLFDLQQEKAKLSYLYETHMLKLEEQPDLVMKATPDQRARLEELAVVFESVARENLQNLKAAHDTGSRVLNAIRRAVEEQNRQTHNYTNGGAESRSPQPVAVSINEQL